MLTAISPPGCYSDLGWGDDEVEAFFLFKMVHMGTDIGVGKGEDEDRCGPPEEVIAVVAKAEVVRRIALCLVVHCPEMVFNRKILQSRLGSANYNSFYIVLSVELTAARNEEGKEHCPTCGFASGKEGCSEK